MSFYFAYGSNLDECQMAERCPGAEVVSPGWLAGFRLTFSGYSGLWQGAVATIVPSPPNVVPGLIWSVTARDKKALDDYEDYPTLYQRMVVDVIDAARSTVSAFTYFIPKRNISPAPPSRHYVDVLSAAYAKWDLDLGPMIVLGCERPGRSCFALPGSEER